MLHVEVYGSEDLLMTNQNQRLVRASMTRPRPAAGTNFSGVSTLQSFWFIKSDHLGKLSVGKQSQASDNTAILVDGSGSLVPANWVAFDYGGFYAGNNGTLAGSDTTLPLDRLNGCSTATV